MKQFWICKWEITPGKGEQIRYYPTLEEAKLAMRRLITKHINLTEFMDKLPPEAADFLEKYLSDPHFPRTKEECPNIFEYLEEDDDDECGDIVINSGYLMFNYDYGLAPQLRTDLVLDEPREEEYHFDFWYEGLWKSTHNGLSDFSFRIRPGVDYGTSSYPLLVLFSLYSTPATQGELIERIADRWKTDIDRKAVGRHLKLLEDMGYPVRHCEAGYYYEGEKTAPKPGVNFTPNTYPLMVAEVLDGTPRTVEAIVRKIHETYGVLIDRKAVSRHLKLLRAIDFPLERVKGGYRKKA